MAAPVRGKKPDLFNTCLIVPPLISLVTSGITYPASKEHSKITIEKKSKHYYLAQIMGNHGYTPLTCALAQNDIKQYHGRAVRHHHTRQQ